MAKPELNPVAKKWVEALRSGKIKQTTQQLGKKDGSRCPLGVLCDLAIEASVIRDYAKHGGWLPVEVMKWAELSDVMCAYKNQSKIRSLVEDNDRAKCSFAKIADIIESQPDGLFRKGDKDAK